MNANEYLQVMCDIHRKIIHYIDSKDDEQSRFEELNTFLTDYNIISNKILLKDFLYLICSLSCNHHRYPNFFDKILGILETLKNQIKSFYTESEIFNIFKGNKRLLLFLFDEKLITPSEAINQTLSKQKYNTYNKYFQAEVEFKLLTNLPFYDFLSKNYNYGFFLSSFDSINYNEIYDTVHQMRKNGVLHNNNTYTIVKDSQEEEEGNDEDDAKEVEEKRRIGENDSYLAFMIRNDLVVDFISYVTKTNISLNSQLKKSIYETNPFLYEKEISLIQYSAFFGSIEILKYLLINKVETDDSLWYFAIHGDNPEIIHLLEYNKIQPENDNYYPLYIESIKCHHNNVANYIEQNYISTEVLKEKKLEIYCTILKNRNFPLFEMELKSNSEYFIEFCKYGYFYIVNSLIESKVDINKASIIGNTKVTALNEAVFHRKSEITELLLKQSKIDINAKSVTYKNDEKFERTALISSIEKGDIQIFKLLMSHPKIDVNECRLINYDTEQSTNYRKEKRSPLSIAILTRNYEMFCILLNHPRINIFIQSELEFGNTHYNDIRYFKDTPFLLTIEFQLVEYFKEFIRNPNIDVNSLYEYKYQYKSTEIAHDEEVSALICAIKRKNTELIDSLLRHPKIDVNLKCQSDNEFLTALYVAYQMKDINVFNTLLSTKNIDVNMFYKYSINDDKNYNCKYDKVYAILQIAFEQNNLEFIKSLLGFQKTLVNLYLKENFDRNKLPQYLEIFKENPNEKTLLQVACERENIEIIKLLLSKHNEDININALSIETTITRNRNNDNYTQTVVVEIVKKTALIMAIERENIELVNLLLEFKNIDTNVNKETIIITINFKSEKGKDGGDWISEDSSRNELNESPLQLAQKSNNQQIIQLLLKQ